MVCEYYCANVKSETMWVVVATLRYTEHIAFDRTLNASDGLFEFFVPTGSEQFFCDLMNEFVARGYVSNFKKEPNRLASGESFL